MSVPPPPAGLALAGSSPDELEQSRGPDSLRVTWADVGGATGFDLQVDGALLADQSPGVTISGLSPNTLHRVEVRSKNSEGSSDFATPPLGVFTRPPTPANSPHVAAGDGARTADALTLDWDFVADQATFHYAYDLEVTDLDNVDFGVLIVPLVPGGTLHKVADGPDRFLLPNVRYGLRVRARDDARGGPGFFSAAALTTATRPPVPQGLAHPPVDLAGQSALLRWAGMGAFHGSGSASIELIRKIGGGAATVVFSTPSVGPGIYADPAPLHNISRRYTTRVRATLAGFGTNESFLGNEVFLLLSPDAGPLAPPAQLQSPQDQATAARASLRSYYGH